MKLNLFTQRSLNERNKVTFQKRLLPTDWLQYRAMISLRIGLLVSVYSKKANGVTRTQLWLWRKVRKLFLSRYSRPSNYENKLLWSCIHLICLLIQWQHYRLQRLKEENRRANLQFWDPGKISLQRSRGITLVMIRRSIHHLLKFLKLKLVRPKLFLRQVRTNNQPFRFWWEINRHKQQDH